MAIEPTAVTIHDSSEIAPTCAMFVGSMMIPEPIMFTATMKVSCIRLMRFFSCMLPPPGSDGGYEAVSTISPGDLTNTQCVVGAVDHLGTLGDVLEPRELLVPCLQ